MTAVYPTSLPVKEAAGANLSSNPHSQLHDDMYDEIVAISTELGTLPKGTFASVKDRLQSAGRMGATGTPATASGSNQTGISSTATDITGLSIAFTAVADRRYKVTVNLTSLQVSADAVQEVIIKTDLATVRARTAHVATDKSMSWCMVEQFVTTAGARTIKAQISTTSGTVTVVNTSSRNATILVEDIGLA